MRGMMERQPLTFEKAREVEETFAEWVRRVRTMKGAQDLMLEGLAEWRAEWKTEQETSAAERVALAGRLAAVEAAVEKIAAGGVDFELDPEFLETMAMVTGEGRSPEPKPEKKKRGRPKKAKDEPEESGDG